MSTFSSDSEYESFRRPTRKRSFSEMSESSENDDQTAPPHRSQGHIPRHLQMSERSPPNDITSSSNTDSDSDISYPYEESRSNGSMVAARSSTNRSRRIIRHGNAETIDLTNEPDSPVPRLRPPNFTQLHSQPSNSAPEVIDLDSEPDRSRRARIRTQLLNSARNSSTDNISFPGQDQDLEVLGVRQIRDRRLPTPVQTRPEDPRNPPPPDPFLRRPSTLASSSQPQGSAAQRGYFEGALQNVFGFIGLRPRASSSIAGRGGPMSIVEPASSSLQTDIRRGLPTGIGATLGPINPPPRQPRNLPTSMDNLPWPNLDYEVQGFQMAVPRPLSPPRREPPEYHPPAKPRPGYTRKIQEDQILVCPRCGDELGAGDDPIKSQVWASKCGHVYCGECARQRAIVSGSKKSAKKEKPKGWKTCVVDGCRQQVSSEKTMLQVYL